MVYIPISLACQDLQDLTPFNVTSYIKLITFSVFRSKKVVSNAGVFNTFDKLLDEKLVEKLQLKKNFDKVKPATSFMQVFIESV